MAEIIQAQALGSPAASVVMVTLIDREQARHEVLPTSLADVVLAALAAEPETLQELEAAVARYDRPILREGFLRHFRHGVNEEPCDAGVMIIDLPARLIATETASAIYQPEAAGYVLYCPDPPPDWAAVADEEITWVRYQLSAEWSLRRKLVAWRAVADRRIAEQAIWQSVDVRAALFGPDLALFIARECLAANSAGIEDPVARIHARWLMTPREDLGGRTPREVMLARCDFIDLDLQWRAHQWSATGECPDGVERSSGAYRSAGFGTHSNVIYFDLIRYLLDECWSRIKEEGRVNLREEGSRLEWLQAQWLEDGCEYSFSPNWILEQERRRLPVAMSPSEAIIDPDCPVCRAAAEDPFGGPTFWHLDGHHMLLEDDFVFSFCRTRDEWEAEQRKWEEFDRRIKLGQ